MRKSRYSMEFNDVHAIISGAIKFEEFGKEFYDTLAVGIDNPKANALFRFLANEEEEHKRQLEEMLKAQFCNDCDVVYDFNAEDMFQDYGDVLESGDHLKVVEYGIELERNSIDLYRKGADMATEEVSKKAFEALVKFEEGHLELLEENLKSLKDGGAWYGYEPMLEG